MIQQDLPFDIVDRILPRTSELMRKEGHFSTKELVEMEKEIMALNQTLRGNENHHPMHVIPLDVFDAWKPL